MNENVGRESFYARPLQTAVFETRKYPTGDRTERFTYVRDGKQRPRDENVEKPPIRTPIIAIFVFPNAGTAVATSWPHVETSEVVRRRLR